VRPPLAIVAVAGAVSIASAQPPLAAARQMPVGVGQTPSALPLSHAIRERGSSVTGAFEGWYRDAGGATRLLVGYFNRNTDQEFDIPIGPDNRIEPGGPDQGQPTHFMTARQWGVFTITVPPDFGSGKLAWTIVSNGFTNTITLHTRPEWIVEPFEDAQKNTPPVPRSEGGGPSFTGPPTTVAARYTATAGEPLAVSAWIADEGPRLNVVPPASAKGRRAGPEPPPLAVGWSKFRGPGEVKFDNPKPPIDTEDGRSTVTATFGAPGDYVIRGEATDSSGPGGGGFQCCWSTVHVGVTVK
jgi:hypothetical protein